MGGCRCYFRDCHASNVKFPYMHFFRFPLKDTERYRKWRQYSKMEHMLQFSVVRRTNIKICPRHFRIECFMNYKMNRLSPSAVPTIMRLTINQALDFELDLENGVLVTLEDTKYPHLIPPVGFECPFFLTNDKILSEKLNQLQNQQYHTSMGLTDEEYYNSGKSPVQGEIAFEESENNFVIPVEYNETAQITTTSSKRPLQIEENPCTSGHFNNKRIRILNKTNSKTIINFEPLSIKLENSDGISDDISYIENEEIENTDLLLNNSKETKYTDYLVVHDITSNELPAEDSHISILQLETNEKENECYTCPEAKSLEFEKKVEERNDLHYSALAIEDNEIKMAGAESKIIFPPKITRNYINKILKDHKILKNELQKYCEENLKLKEDTTNIEILRAKLLSSKEETKELKKQLETLKNSQLNVSNQQINFTPEEKTLNEINTLKINLDLKDQLQRDTATELKEVKGCLIDMKVENSRLSEHQIKLEQAHMNLKNNFEIKQNDFQTLQSEYDNLQQKYNVTLEKYLKLHELQNQESTVSTSLEIKSSNANCPVPNPLTKAQLFKGIKRYLNASMVSFLRMEMFASSEREWKTDERQIAVDILRLGEMVYKYFTDEWRFHLPALRDVHNWANQSEQIIEDDDDL